MFNFTCEWTKSIVTITNTVAVAAEEVLVVLVAVVVVVTAAAKAAAVAVLVLVVVVLLLLVYSMLIGKITRTLNSVPPTGRALPWRRGTMVILDMFWQFETVIRVGQGASSNSTVGGRNPAWPCIPKL